MIISGWANNSIIRSEIFYPKNEHEIIEIVKSLKNESIITRGLGRSYGDISLNKNTLSLEKCEKHFKLDKDLGILSCSANISIVEILEKIVNNGWLLNISPGSKFVTIGGAIANDVHGKNHHIDGSFSDYIEKIKIVTPDGVIRECSDTINQELFRATCGGAGLTGVITSVNLKLLKIKSKNIDVQIFKTKNIKETLKKFEELKKNKYLVAWLDTVNIGSYIKSVIFAAEHSVDNDLDFKIKKGFKIPNFLGKFLINNFFMSIFNKIYYFLHRDSIKIKKDLDSFFYPLDQVCNLNELYGKKGFTQIQVLIKSKDKDKYEKILNQILNFFKEKKIYSFLTTLKEYGEGNNNYLSFPEKGLCIALDIPLQKNFLKIYKEFEKNISNYNVKIYLAKDSFMSEIFFKNSYDKIMVFNEFKKKIDPNSKFKSVQSERLGL
jgi:decaprenylphospho-beta-D-ribofuranose 2-oxidase